MRSSNAPAMLVAASLFAQRATAFVIAPSPSCSNPRFASFPFQQQHHISSSRSSSEPLTCRALSIRVAQPLLRCKRRLATAVSAGGQGDEAFRELTADKRGANPEDLMRQMSIPDLVQKLEKAEGTFGQTHPQVAQALIPLAQALYANGDLGPARESCTRSLKILQAAYGQSPRVETAECLHTLAMIQRAESPEIGDKALGSQNMALELAMRVCGPDSIEVAAYSRCLAQMSEDYAKYLAPDLPRPFYMPNPVPLYRKTLSILEKLFGAEDPEVASALDDLASALLFWRDDEFTSVKAVSMLPEAESLATRSLDISRACLGAEHPMTAGREHNVGMVKRGLGREDEAREHFQRALTIREKTLGPDHPETKASRDLVEGKDSASAGP